MTSNVPRGRSRIRELFPIRCSQDKMTAFIPAESNISQDIYKLNFDTFSKYLFALGYKRAPKKDVLDELKKALGEKEYLDYDYILIKGRPVMAARDAIIKWLNPPEKPRDLVYPSIPFAIIYPARATIPAQNVLGETVPLESGEMQPAGKDIVLGEGLQMEANGEVISQIGGQSTFKNFELQFSDTYKITSMKDEKLHNLLFPCNVQTLCDVEPYVEWTIHGNYTAEQFCSAYKIKVEGNCITKGGLQTNFPNDETKSFYVKGDLTANFIQSSRLLVEGNVKVEKSITGSHLTIAGNLECMGDPGRIVGSEIVMKSGSVNAKVVGGEMGTPSSFRFFTQDGSMNSKIENMLEGTRVQILKKKIIVKMTQPWPPPAQ